MLGGGDGLAARFFCLGLGAAFFLAFGSQCDLSLLLCDCDVAFAGDFGGLYRLLHRDSGGSGFAFAVGLAAGDFCNLCRCECFYFLLLGDLRAALFEFYFQSLARGFHAGATYGYFALGVDFGAFLFRFGDDFGKLSHTDGVKRVVFIECGEGGLIECGQ